MTDLLTNLPNYYNSITSKISELPEDNILRSEKAVEVMNNIKDIDLNQYINMEKIQSYIKSIISAVETIFNIFISVIVSIYILSQRNRIIKFLSRLTHSICKEKNISKNKKIFQ